MKARFDKFSKLVNTAHILPENTELTLIQKYN